MDYQDNLDNEGDISGTSTNNLRSTNNHNNTDSDVNNNNNNNNDNDNNSNSNSNDEVLFTKGIKQLNNLGLIDIGNLAVWEVSSFKSGCNIDKLRDDSPLTFWQSDGQQPHYLIIKFTKCVNIERLSIFLNYAIDESYTPDKISIFAGTGEYDLIEVIEKEFFEPIGWQHIEFENISNSGYLKCYMLKIKFISNHQNGKDCHVRSVKIMSPILFNSINSTSTGDDLENFNSIGFTSIKFQSESQIR